MAARLKQCDTCRHWGANRWSNLPMSDDYMWGTCHLAGGHDGEPDNNKSLAWADDGGSYRAVLNTRANFGCIQHEER